jgi:hypothetical protein
MSHFTVAVIADHPDMVPDLLAPYQENNMGDCPSEYMEFNDVEEKCREEWENESCAEWYADVRYRVGNENLEEKLREIKERGHHTFIFTEMFDMRKISDGARVALCGHIDNESGSENYREIFGEIDHYRELSGEEIWENMTEEAQKDMRENYEDEEDLQIALGRMKQMEVHVNIIDGPSQIPYKEQYPDFTQFIEEYQGYEKDEKTGKYGYWENPNAKWDWYEVGGRWMGSLLVKEGKQGMLGSPGVFGNDVPNTPSGYTWADSCYIKDVEWDKMRQIREFELLKSEGDDGDLWDILTCAIDVSDKVRMNYTWYKPEYFIEKYGSKENYLKMESSFGTYAVITPDGKWHAPGDMGWFGMSSDSLDDAKEFQDNFHKNFIEKYPDKTITIIDCHI